MACLTALDMAEAQLLAAEYGLRLVNVEALEAGSVNSNFRFDCETGPVFARIYEEQDAEGAAAELRVLEGLSKVGVPVSAALPRLDGGLVGITSGGKPFSVYPWVVGEWLCHQRLRESHCHALGRALARVHEATPTLGELPKGRFGEPELRARLEHILRHGPEFEDSVRFIERGLEQYVSSLEGDLPQGLIHGDLFRDNVLWQLGRDVDSPEIAALLDFESASQGAFVYDLMVCVLSWCFTSELELRRVNALLDGYESVRPLSELERRATTTEGMAVCLRFATTRITDFAMRTPKGAEPTRDFRRFLQRYSVLQAGAMGQVWRERALRT